MWFPGTEKRPTASTIRPTLAQPIREDRDLIHRTLSLRTGLFLVAVWVVAIGTGPGHASAPPLDATSNARNGLSGDSTYTVRDRAKTNDGHRPAVTAMPDLLHVSEVQGSGATVAITGPVTLEAVVTSLFEHDDLLSGFFLQEEDTDTDGDPATSEGIFVHCSNACPEGLAVGDRVTVVGVAGEFGGVSQIDASAGSVTIRSSGNDLPIATPVTLPAPGSTRTEGTFENVEGMIVTFAGKLVISEYYWLARYGELVLTDGSRPYQFTHRHAPSAGGIRRVLGRIWPRGG